MKINGERLVIETQLTPRVASLETDVRNILGSVDRLTNSVDSLTKKMGKPTDWIALATWATAIIFAISTLGYLSVEPIRADVRDARVAVLRLEQARIRDLEKQIDGMQCRH